MSNITIGIIKENKVSTMAADALAPYVAKASAAMVLTRQDELVLVLREEEWFQLIQRAISMCVCIFICFFKIIPSVNVYVWNYLHTNIN